MKLVHLLPRSNTDALDRNVAAVLQQGSSSGSAVFYSAMMPFQLRNDHFSIRMNTRIRGRASVPALAYTCRCTSRDVCLCLCLCLCLWSYQSLSARQARQQPSWSLTPATPWPPEPIMMPAVTFGHVAEVDNATRRCNIDWGVSVSQIF